MKNFYRFGMAVAIFMASMSSAQNLVLLQQAKQPDGNMISGSTTNGRSVHVADDFVLTSAAKLNKITLQGAQIFQNLPSIYTGADVYIIKAEQLEGAPGSENAIYSANNTKDGINLESRGYEQDFVLDFSTQNIVLEANQKYWIVFSARINMPYNSSTGDWHSFPGENSTGTSLAQVYTNGAWSTQNSGLTFILEGNTTLGTSEVFTSRPNFLRSTLVKEQLEIISDDIATVKIIDLTGKQILVSEKRIIKTETLTAGTYLVVATTKQGKTLTAKIIKR